MKPIILASLALALAGPVLAQSAMEKSGINSALGVAPKTEDFVQEAAGSDMFEIESSRLAIERSDAATKAFAQQMVADHEKTTTELTGLISSGKVTSPVPADMTSAQRDKLEKLKSLQGDDFTKQYHSDQEEAHEDAVDLFTRYSEGGDNVDLKAWTAATLPALKHHLEMAKGLNP
ncbi:DUF4142 domain-containing protein [Ensifer sp.]|uniref:DUF4142 domain-containing protein n=1 Tax=Ensifer sp. TaxID=1872086 RepID=UPI0028966172|nr:DUF4142 domain-containing protein [Ensifer sp.]